MARIKGGLNAKKKHNRVLKLAKGYRGARSKQYRIAKQTVSTVRCWLTWLCMTGMALQSLSTLLRKQLRN